MAKRKKLGKQPAIRVVGVGDLTDELIVQIMRKEARSIAAATYQMIRDEFPESQVGCGAFDAGGQLMITGLSHLFEVDPPAARKFLTAGLRAIAEQVKKHGVEVRFTMGYKS